MSWLGILILSLLVLGVATTFHPTTRRTYRRNYTRARRYAYDRYDRRRRRY